MKKVKLYNKELCPLIWNGMVLRPEIRINLLKLAKEFYEKTDLKAPIKDIYLMGSVANYNWTSDSDLDVHILIDFNQLQMPLDTASSAVKAMASQWNDTHNVIIKGHPVEINIQNIEDEKKHVTGIYSLASNEWIRKPIKNPNPNINKRVILNLYEKYKGQIEHAIQTGDRNYMKDIKEYLSNFRQYGLDTKGELSKQNIVYKLLRSTGVIKKLTDEIINVYDSEFSLDEIEIGNDDYVPQKGKVKSFDNYMDGLSDDDKYELASKYFSIGHEDDHYCWILDPSSKKIKVGKGRTHNIHFNQPNKDETFSGWYDPDENKLSVVFPSQILHTLKGQAPTISDIPRDVYDKLMKKFGNKGNSPKFVVFEGYGAGKPEDDPKIPKGKRWTVKFDSSSKPLKESVTQKDLRQSLPSHVDDKMIANNVYDFSKLTLDNLNALKDKIRKAFKHEKKAEYLAAFNAINDEIKKRLKYINSPLEEGRDYLGSTWGGECTAVPFDDAKGKVHHQHGMISGVNSHNWRYFSEKNTVVWNMEPTPEDKDKVDSFLQKRGVVNPKHKNMYTYYLQDAFDPTSVGPNPQASEGSNNDGFYQSQIDQMRTMENISLMDALTYPTI